MNHIDGCKKGWRISGCEGCELAISNHEELAELVISLRFWFNNGQSPKPSTLWDDGETWKQKVQKVFENLAAGSEEAI